VITQASLLASSAAATITMGVDARKERLDGAPCACTETQQLTLLQLPLVMRQRASGNGIDIVGVLGRVSSVLLVLR
jgi:hypothetical protein